MRSRAGSSALATAFIRHRRSQAILLLVLGWAIATGVIVLSSVRGSAERAIDDSLRADLGGRAYALQTGDPAVIALLAGLRSAAPVQDDNGDVSLRDTAVPVQIRRTTDPTLELGQLTSGVRPHNPGDALLSEPAANALGIRLGDRIQVRTGTGTAAAQVVGLSVDPADAANRTLFQLVPSSPAFQPTRWLSEQDFYSDGALQPALDARAASYQSIDTLLDAAAQNRPQFLSAMRFLPTGAGLLLGLMLVTVVIAMSQRWRRYAEALMAAGMPSGTAWRRIIQIVLACLIGGELLGGVVSVGALWLLRSPVSGWFGQHWIHVAVPPLGPILLLLLTVASGLVAAPVIRRAPSWIETVRRRHGRPERQWITGVLSAAGLALTAIWVLTLRAAGSDTGGETAAALAPYLAAALVATLPFIISGLVTLGLPRATRKMLRHIVSGLRPVVAIGAVVVLGSAIWAAQTTHDANRGQSESSPLVPAGSLVISSMPDRAIAPLAGLYREKGGSDVQSYRIPDERKGNLRISSPGLLQCLSKQPGVSPDQLPESCFPQQTASPINVVMIGAAGSAPRADPGLIQNGEVGLLLFTGTEGRVTDLALTKAEPDRHLGGNLPGLVLPADSAALQRFSVIPSGTSEVALLDFGHLDQGDQILVRSAVIRLAAGAEMSDGTDPTGYDRLRSIANTVGVMGALAGAILILLGGMAIVVANSLTRRTLVDLGTGPGPRWRFLARLMVTPTLTAALTIPIAILTASYGVASNGASYGWIWLLPGSLAVLASLVVGAAFLRVPDRTSE